MLITSPLVWHHYNVVLLVPIAWLLRLDHRFDAASALALASYVLATDLAWRALSAAGLLIVPVLIAITWPPLLAALLLRIARDQDVALSRPPSATSRGCG